MGVFIAIGHVPNTAPFKGTELDENGYLIPDSNSMVKTSIGEFMLLGIVQTMYTGKQSPLQEWVVKRRSKPNAGYLKECKSVSENSFSGNLISLLTETVKLTPEQTAIIETREGTVSSKNFQELYKDVQIVLPT